MPLHIIYGDDPLARKEAFDRLKASLDSDGSLATNITTFEAKSTTPQELIAACNTIPFLGDCRLVVIQGLLEGSGRGKRGRGRRVTAPADADDLEGEASLDPGPWVALAGYVPTMPPTTTLVLLDAAAPATGLLKSLGPLGTVEKFTTPLDKELPGWVMSRAKTIGLKLDAPAGRLLAELIGSDPYMLASELDKLLAYSAGAVVRVDAVRELVSRAKEHKGYELADAVVDGQGAKAARILSELIVDGQPSQLLLATVAGRYRRIAIAKDMMERGESGSAISRRLNVKMGFGLDKLMEQAQRTSDEAIREAYARLIQAELDVKRGLIDNNDVLALELAVQELASRPAASARA